MAVCDLVILAAGKGTRMRSRLPKVLHPLGGKPLILHTVGLADAVTDRPPVVVVGHEAEAVHDVVGASARFVHQPEQLGTGHAVLQARSLLEGLADYIIVIYADMPLLRGETLQMLLARQQAGSAPFSMLTQVSESPRGFGRIVRNKGGAIQAIVEEKVATPEQRAIKEINLGIYCFTARWLWEHLDQIPVSPVGEYYLTDLAAIAVADGHHIETTLLEDPAEAIGINTRVHLAEAEAALRRRTNERLMLAGVTIHDPGTTYIEPDVMIGEDTVILPNTFIKGNTRIGEGCVIGPNSVIDNAQIGNGCTILSSVVEYATLEDAVEIGPFGHLRRGAYLEEGVHMGNFGEVKNSRLRKGVKMGHFSYLGDADVGEDTNIGAGTITCNYDGVNKHRTVIGKGTFVGSDTMLVAPVTLGDGARTGAGSVVTRDVAPGELVYGVPARPRQESLPQDRGDS